jgi:hypothetical protein
MSQSCLKAVLTRCYLINLSFKYFFNILTLAADEEPGLPAGDIIFVLKPKADDATPFQYHATP